MPKYPHQSKHPETKINCGDCAYIIQQEFSIYQAQGRYIYVSGKSDKELVVNVNKKIEEGYEPLGSPNITTYTSGGISNGSGEIKSGWSYLQFMLKAK